MRSSWLKSTGFLFALCASAGCGRPAFAPAAAGGSQPLPAQVTPRGVVLRGNRPAFAIADRRIGEVAPQFAMDRMALLLQPADRPALDALAAEQQDPSSPLYHQWLTPAQYAEQFGAPAAEVAQVASWLTGQGFVVDEVTPNGRMIFFSGSAGQVNTAFHARMSRFSVGGATRMANAAEPAIPAALAEEVEGIVGLHDLRSTASHSPVAEFATGSANYIAPADLGAIYDITPLYQQGITGAGTTIAVLARSNLLPGDIAAFRGSFGLPAQTPQVIVNGADPGTGNEQDLEETELDAEWAGAIAPQAAIEVVASASTQTTDGILLSAEYAVDHNLAPVIAVSYAECESDLGSAENAVYNDLWQQAAVEGITVVVAAGDSGAAGCDSPSETAAKWNQAVNGLCSSPYSLCVGGSEFTGQGDAWWAQQNNAGGGSALGYVPEAAWNESGELAGGNGLWAGGGGSSAIYARPAWQPGSGSLRLVPDVALASAGRNGYLVWLHGAQAAMSGTSAAAQVMGGIAALLVSGREQRLGNIAPSLYAIAGVDPGAFHDMVSGDNSVPGAAGFSAAPGYDEATGLGSLDAAALLSGWSSASPQQRPCALASAGLFRNCAPLLPLR